MDGAHGSRGRRRGRCGRLSVDRNLLVADAAAAATGVRFAIAIGVALVTVPFEPGRGGQPVHPPLGVVHAQPQLKVVRAQLFKLVDEQRGGRRHGVVVADARRGHVVVVGVLVVAIVQPASLTAQRLRFLLQLQLIRLHLHLMWLLLQLQLLRTSRQRRLQRVHDSGPLGPTALHRYGTMHPLITSGGRRLEQCTTAVDRGGCTTIPSRSYNDGVQSSRNGEGAHVYYYYYYCYRCERTRRYENEHVGTVTTSVTDSRRSAANVRIINAARERCAE